MKITICGSMSFLKEMEELKKKLKELGHEVITPFPDESYSQEINVKKKAMEDFNYNLGKSDAILISNYNKGGKQNYIGVNSIMEIGMAFNQGKKIFVLNEIPKECEDELKAINVIELNNNLSKIK